MWTATAEWRGSGRFPGLGLRLGSTERLGSGSEPTEYGSYLREALLYSPNFGRVYRLSGRQIRETEPPAAQKAGRYQAGIIAASVEPERLALLRPGEWQIGILGELSGRQAGRLAAFEDVARDFRREISQPEHAGKVGFSGSSRPKPTTSG